MGHRRGIAFVHTLHRWYRAIVPPIIGEVCRFEPSCSFYAVEAIERYGYLRGSALTVRRLMRCNPWCRGGHDPVPPREDGVENRSVAKN
ncbi:MAG: hypothetical protein RL417_906 [Pseudomonadota bacterium]|jgi:putative membrane protein insertion efficiency factor